ncbi:MAG: nucleotidyltransferase domain-containing protein [Leptolyngbya sp.]|nr:nucleotidyltransferase domain-containing protein [Candidatus Melainabacteria bacterium]
MTKNARRRVAEEAARLLVEGSEREYLQAKERAISMLGLSGMTHLPSNRVIRDCMAQLTECELGADEVKRRVREMRQIAVEIMQIIEDFDPYLIGSTLTGKIRSSSDIDLHAYSDEHPLLVDLLANFEYKEVEEEIVENRKGKFVHLKWFENDYPVEITVYPWSWRDIVQISSVTGKPMQRMGLESLKKMLKM